MKAPATKNELALKYVSITPFGEVRLTCGKNVFRLFKKKCSAPAEVTAGYLAQSIQRILKQEMPELMSDNLWVRSTLYQIRQYVENMLEDGDCNRESVEELYDTFFSAIPEEEARPEDESDEHRSNPQ